MMAGEQFEERPELPCGDAGAPVPRAAIKAASDAFEATHQWVVGQGVRDLNKLSHADLKSLLEAAICDARNHYFEQGQFDFDGETASWCATLLLAARGEHADADPVQP